MSQNEYLKLIQEIHSSFAYRVHGRLETLRVNYFVFSRNYGELRRALEGFSNSKKTFELLDSRSREKLDIIISEVIRLLHNYLTSAKTLIEHTRIVIREWYKETDFLQEYNDEVKARFSNNSLAAFIQELRNYSLHYTLPLANASFSVNMIEGGKGGTIDFAFILNKSSLLHWSGWKKNKQAMEYLNNSEDEISVNLISEEYFPKLKTFISGYSRK